MTKLEADSNVAVFTTNYVVRKGSPIVFVLHDEDGDWQFFGPENDVTEDDAMVVAMTQIIELDPSIMELEDMPEGYRALRNTTTSKWQISKF